MKPKRIKNLYEIPKKREAGVFTLRASRSGPICFVAKGSQSSSSSLYEDEGSFTLRASYLGPPRLVNMSG
jgi:hypothetical protein